MTHMLDSNTQKSALPLELGFEHQCKTVEFLERTCFLCMANLHTSTPWQQAYFAQIH